MRPVRWGGLGEHVWTVFTANSGPSPTHLEQKGVFLVLKKIKPNLKGQQRVVLHVGRYLASIVWEVLSIHCIVLFNAT